MSISLESEVLVYRRNRTYLC